jgi:hypothetical protein
MLLNKGLWVTESEFKGQQIEDPKVEPPECGFWPEGVPKPHEAFFSFLRSTAIRKAPDKAGEFIGSVLLHLSTNATFGGMKGETRHKLMEEKMANDFLGEKANQAIEETVADFRGRITKILTTPKDEIEPDSGVPGLGLNKHPKLGLIDDARVEQAVQDRQDAIDNFTRLAGEEGSKRTTMDSARAAKISADADFATAGTDLETAKAKVARINTEAAGIEPAVAAGTMTSAEAAQKVSVLSAQMAVAKRELADAEGKVTIARAEAARKQADLESATAAHRIASGARDGAKQQMDVACVVLNMIAEHRARIDERADELAEHFRDELLCTGDSGGNINTVITKVEKRVVHPDVWKVAREERISELTALMEEIKACYPKDTRTALTSKANLEDEIKAQLESGALRLKALAAESEAVAQRQAQRQIEGTKDGHDSEAMVKPEGSDSKPIILEKVVVEMYQAVLASDDEHKLKKLGDFFYRLKEPELGAAFLGLYKQLRESKKDEVVDAEFEDRRAEFAKKLGELKADIDASGLPPTLRARMTTLHDMIDSCSHEKGAIEGKAKLIMETYAYPVRAAAKKSVECFDERRFENLTDIPESQWIVARMIFESQSKGIESETGLKSDGPWKKGFQKVLGFISKEGGKRIVRRVWAHPWPLLFARLPLTTSPKEDYEAARSPWTEKALGRNWRSETVDSFFPRRIGGGLGAAIKIYVAGGFLLGHFASHDEVRWYNPTSYPAPIVHKIGMNPRVDERHWYRPDTWWRGLKGDERIVRVFDDSYDLPQKLTERPDSYFTSESGFNLGTQLSSESDRKEANARLEWARGQPEVLRFMQERILTPQRNRPMRVVDSRQLRIGEDKMNPDACGGGKAVFEDQEQTAEQKKAAEKEDVPEYHWYRPGSWAHFYTPWKGVTDDAQKTEAPKADTAKPDEKAAPKDDKGAAKPDEKPGAAKPDDKAGERKTEPIVEMDGKKVPVACTRTFGWSAPADVKFGDVFVDGRTKKSGASQTRIGGTVNQTVNGVQRIKTEVPLLKPDPKTGRYAIDDLASYMPISNPEDGWTTENRFCCAISIRYADIPDARVLNRAPGFADKLVADVMGDIFMKDENGDLVPNTVNGRGPRFVDDKGHVKREYFEDQRTVYRMVESGQLVSQDQGTMMKDLGFYKIASVDFLRSKPRSASVQKFVRMCTKGDDPKFIRKENPDHSKSKPRDYFVRTWMDNIRKALPDVDPVMDSVPEETMEATLKATVKEMTALTDDVSKEYEQGKLKREFKGLKLSQTALDILYAQKDICGVVQDYNESTTEPMIVKPRASEFVYAMAEHKKAKGDVREFSLRYSKEAEDTKRACPKKTDTDEKGSEAETPKAAATEQGPKVKWAVAKGYLSKTGDVEDNGTVTAAKGDAPEAFGNAESRSFWETQKDFANTVTGIEDGLHYPKKGSRLAKGAGEVYKQTLDKVYGKDEVKMDIAIKGEIYRVLSATDNKGTDKAAKDEKEAFDARQKWGITVTGEKAGMKVEMPKDKKAAAKAEKQVQDYVADFVHKKLATVDASTPQLKK